MTIEVRIENKDHARDVDVQILDLDKENGLLCKGEKRGIGPGCSQTFYVHLLRDLIVSERNPS